MRASEFITEAWSAKYKRSINCSNPKGFSQKAHCQGRNKNEEVELEERKKKRKKVRAAAYGPGPYGLYGSSVGYSGDGGGVEESAGDYGNIPTGPQQQLIPFPKGTTMIDVSDVYDWYKLGMVISDLDDANPAAFGKGAPSTVIAFGSEEEENKMLPLLKRLGLKLHDIDSPQDVKKVIPAKQLVTDLAEAIRQHDENFANGKNPGRKGLSKRVGVNTKASVSDLRKTAKNSTGEKQRMAHWLANMKAGKKK